MMKIGFKKKNRVHCGGYAMLITILIITALAGSITAFVLLFGATATKTALQATQSGKASYLADACAEEALNKIRESNSFIGTGNLTLGNGTCAYTVTSTGGQGRQVVATGTVGSLIRKVKVTVTAVNPQVTISSWQELPDF